MAASKQGAWGDTVFLDEIFDAAALLENEHEDLLVVRGSWVHGSLGGWPSGLKTMRLSWALLFMEAGSLARLQCWHCS